MGEVDHEGGKEKKGGFESSECQHGEESNNDRSCATLSTETPLVDGDVNENLEGESGWDTLQKGRRWRRVPRGRREAQDTKAQVLGTKRKISNGVGDVGMATKMGEMESRKKRVMVIDITRENIDNVEDVASPTNRALMEQ